MSWNEPILPWAIGPDYPHWSEQLRDGTRVTIRPISKADIEREREFIEGLSPESRRFRFLGQISHPSEQLLATLANVDYVHDVAFAAVLPEDADGRFLGVSRYSTASDASSCECAVAVLDKWQDRGLGTMLMKHLIQVARARGINFMFSRDAPENGAMADLAHYLGFQRRTDPEDASLVLHSLWLATRPD